MDSKVISKSWAAVAWALPIAMMLLAGAARAQSPGSPAVSPKAADGEEAAQVGGAERDTARFFLLQRMRESLGLSDAQSLKVLDLMRAMDGERASHRRANREILRRIQSILEGQAASDAPLKEQVALFQRERARFESKLRDLEQGLLDALTPRQQGQYLVLRRQLMDRLQGREDSSPAPRQTRSRRGR